MDALASESWSIRQKRNRTKRARATSTCLQRVTELAVLHLAPFLEYELLPKNTHSAGLLSGRKEKRTLRKVNPSRSLIPYCTEGNCGKKDQL
jgi:hypothetical protein